jgi:hypothetical protein
MGMGIQLEFVGRGGSWGVCKRKLKEEGFVCLGDGVQDRSKQRPSRLLLFCTEQSLPSHGERAVPANRPHWAREGGGICIAVSLSPEYSHAVTGDTERRG